MDGWASSLFEAEKDLMMGRKKFFRSWRNEGKKGSQIAFGWGVTLMLCESWVVSFTTNNRIIHFRVSSGPVCKWVVVEKCFEGGEGV